MSFRMYLLFLSVSVCLCFSVCPSLCVSLSDLWVCSPNISLAFYVSISLKPNLYLSVWYISLSVSLTPHSHTHTHTHTHTPLYISLSVFPCLFSQRSSNDKKKIIISGHIRKRYLPVLSLSVYLSIYPSHILLTFNTSEEPEHRAKRSRSSTS